MVMMHVNFICQKTKNWGLNDCNNKREDSTEADGLGDTPIKRISSLPTTNRLSAFMYHSFTYVATNRIYLDFEGKQ